jgi:CheY-like chemotaxis protein
MRDRSGATRAARSRMMPETHTALAGKRVLAVEDEGLVAMWLEDLLTDLGCVVVGPANSIEVAFELLERDSIELAVLDINIAGEKVFPVAERLAARNVPFVFATGYGASGVVEPFAQRPVVQKPYTLEVLKRALESVISSPLSN